MQVIDNWAATDLLYEVVQVVGPGDAGVPGTVIAQIPGIAGLEIDPVDVLESGSEIGFINQPIDAGGLARRENTRLVANSSRHHFLEWCTGGRIGIGGNRTTKI